MDAAADQHGKVGSGVSPPRLGGVTEQAEAVGGQEWRVLSGDQTQAQQGEGFDVARLAGAGQPVDGLAVTALLVQGSRERHLRPRVSRGRPPLQIRQGHRRSTRSAASRSVSP